MNPKCTRLFQWIAILCALAAAGFGSRCAAQSKTPVRSEGERLLLEMERKPLDAKSQLLRTRVALELPFLITATPSATEILRSYCRVRLSSAIEQLDAPTVPEYSRGQFKAVVKEMLDGRDAFKVEWYTERSVVVPAARGGGCMFCRPGPVAPKAIVAPQYMTVQDKYIVWLDATTKLPIKQVSPNGMVEHYRPFEINPKLDASRFDQAAGK